MKRLSNYAKYAWGLLLLNQLVILWGAYVRATGSGAGCGSHWPLCNGEVIPPPHQIETVIEFTHRVTSGLALRGVLGLLIFAFRLYPRGHRVRLGAVLSSIFIILEALVGAVLVRFEWVAFDASMGRVISMGVHLVNTFLLLAALSLTAWWASGGGALRLRGLGAALWGLGWGFLGLLVLGVTGAITALGDTLFPAASLAEGLAADFHPESHFLVRLRVWHPVVALTVGFYLALTAGLIAMFRPQRSIRRAALALGALFVIQLAAGLVNLLLRAPVWMQIIHLLLADLVWISAVLLAAETFSQAAQPAAEAERPAQPLAA